MRVPRLSVFGCFLDTYVWEEKWYLSKEVKTRGELGMRMLCFFGGGGFSAVFSFLVSV